MGTYDVVVQAGKRTVVAIIIETDGAVFAASNPDKFAAIATA